MHNKMIQLQVLYKSFLNVANAQVLAIIKSLLLACKYGVTNYVCHSQQKL